ncbi:MAG TPA: hypothetical protein VGK45_06875, partial [Thermoanaerobaculia bacterium]
LPGGGFAVSWSMVGLPNGQTAVVLSELRSRPLALLSSVVVATDDVFGPFHLELSSFGDGVVYWSTLDPDGHFSGHLSLVSFR